MTIIIVEHIPEKLRGELKNSLLEIKHNIFIGKISKRIREILWTNITKQSRCGIMAYTNDMVTCGFVLQTHGKTPVSNVQGIYMTNL
jgi:CRISPR-associated protein Cas2